MGKVVLNLELLGHSSTLHAVRLVLLISWMGQASRVVPCAAGERRRTRVLSARCARRSEANPIGGLHLSASQPSRRLRNPWEAHPRRQGVFIPSMLSILDFGERRLTSRTLGCTPTSSIPKISFGEEHDVVNPGT
uniref:Predicted protein n=1 Tax=Hordeum vulgare subsp. vulgare TaxID=112509 RepID=F2CXU3_HORVV|nr:predicted protein [Hordeum vulgare subsp. vulgare]